MSLPTPFAPVHSFVAYRDQGAVEPLYEARMQEELGCIRDAITAGDLAVQRDRFHRDEHLQRILNQALKRTAGGWQSLLPSVGR